MDVPEVQSSLCQCPETRGAGKEDAGVRPGVRWRENAVTVADGGHQHEGESSDMVVQDAVAMIHAMPPERRSRFAKEIWRRRRQYESR